MSAIDATFCSKLLLPPQRLGQVDYRILYEIVDRELLVTVVGIGHRCDVYR